MAQSKKSSNELRQLLLKTGAVVPTSDALHTRSFDKVASQANAIASRRKELNKVPTILRSVK